MMKKEELISAGGLVVGSHKDGNINEVVVISCNAPTSSSTSQEDIGGRRKQIRICEICGEEILNNFTSTNANTNTHTNTNTNILEDEGDLFVGCNECGFPICKTCYDYERLHGTQLCPLCKTRFPRLKGCPRVEGDEEEDDIDDLDNEFNFQSTITSSSSSYSPSHHDTLPRFPLLTSNAHKVVDVSSSEKSHHNPISGKHNNIRSMQHSSKDLNVYGYGSVSSKQKHHDKLNSNTLIETNNNGDSDDPTHYLPVLMDEARQPLSRKFPIASSQINPYRMIIITRLVVLGFFFHYRLTHPVKDAYALWLISVICELWFALSWILDQFPRWLPVERETYLDRLSLRYEKEGEGCELCSVDIFVSTVDPLKEPPIVTANTVLSILAVDYPVEKVSCYVSDDAAAMLTFEALSETCEFAKKWVPFCKNFDIEPRAPEWYFAHKLDYAHQLKQNLNLINIHSFVKERRAIKREYEEFKVRINGLVAKAQKVPEQGWTMPDGTPWPGNNVGDHPGIIQIFLGQSGQVLGTNGNDLPRLVYVSREKRPGFNHHKKAGAMNALVRVSAVLTNAPYILNLDYDQYVNNSKVLREAMCFMMDPLLGNKVCYVQFPQRFDGLDSYDRYANRNTVFFDINMKGLDGIQGPIYIGTGCVFRRQALYGFDAPKTNKSANRTCNCWPKWWCCLGKNKSKVETSDLRCDEQKLENKYGQSSVFVASTLVDDTSAPVASLVKEAIHVISCGYEAKTEWGKEIGWMYGSVREDILTGFKMHCQGWRSIYCDPERPAFIGSAATNLSDGLHQVLGWAVGSVEILLSRHCPVWYGYGGGLKWLERVSYINATVYPWTSIPLVAYCALPAVCLLTRKFIIPELSSNVGSLWFVSLFMCIFGTSMLEMRWSGVGIDEWWRNQQFWVIGGVSAHLFALFQGLFKVIVGVDTSSSTNTSKSKSSQLMFAFNWTCSLLIPPTTLLVINLIAVVAGVSDAINNAYVSWGPLFGKLLFAFWVILHLYPFFKGLLGRHNRTPAIVILWSILLASIFSLFWVRIHPFIPNSDYPFLEECGLDCTTI